jgi:hypothetical protein
MGHYVTHFIQHSEALKAIYCFCGLLLVFIVPHLMLIVRSRRARP